ncbi:MAG: histidine phosphatase family protein [Polyangiaceae bacterium]|nr:histidine phosphatase family protein [Polyangiaceae bacterium]
MKLYVMRHGPAEDQATSGQDADRALSPGGRERVRRVAEALVAGDEAPLHIVTSQLVRAVQTAEVVAVITGLSERGGTVDVRRELAPAGDAAGLARAFAREGQKRVLLVGHEPDLSSLAAALLGRFDGHFDKAMVVGIHLGADDVPARLRFVLDPKATPSFVRDLRGAIRG